MKSNKGPSNTNSLLWWIAAISLIVSGVLYYLLGSQADIDISMRQNREIFPLIGIIIAGVCVIIGTAGRWFYPK